MDASEIRAYIEAMPGVVVVVGGADNGAPEIAWGDSFFFYDPDDNIPPNKRMPFTTIVTKDYPGFDASSELDRPGIFRVNVWLPRATFATLFTADDDPPSYAALDTVIPHPVYAAQSWACVLNPGHATAAQLRGLLAEAHHAAVLRHGKRNRTA